MDPDNDGVFGLDDDCPNQPGPESNYGCPDEDHDDEECDPAYDACTSDSDGDGVIDYWDDCPNQSGTDSNYGCPEGVEPDDSDGDAP